MRNPLLVLAALGAIAACGSDPTWPEDKDPGMCTPPVTVTDTLVVTDTLLVIDTLMVIQPVDTVEVPGKPVQLISRLWCWQATEPDPQHPDIPLKLKVCSLTDPWPELPLRVVP